MSERSFAVLQFIDSAEVTMRPDTTLVIEQYGYTGGDEDTATLPFRRVACGSGLA